MSPESSAGKNTEAELSTLLDIRIPGDPSRISSVTDAITDTLTKLDVPEEKRLEITLAVQEALANAVIHGCNSDASLEVRCRLQRDQNGRIVIIVTDPGPGFQPEAVSNPKQTENLYQDHGRGVYLIRQLMDEVEFENGGNQIRMWKY